MSKGNHRRRAGRGEGSSTSGIGSAEAQNSGHRHARLERVLTEELKSLLRDELSDPVLESIGFTQVELSTDFRTARVRFALRGERPTNSALDTAQRALERATPVLRGLLVDALELKRVPNLRFVPDRDASGTEQLWTSLSSGDSCE